MSNTKVVWLANNVSHYHRARGDAFARRWGGGVTILELSGRNALPVLQRGACEEAAVVTLWRDRVIEELGAGEVAERVTAELERLQPAVCCVNGWGLPGAAAMLEWAVGAGVPCVLMSETNGHDGEKQWWKEEPKRRFVGQCSAALVGGRWHREYLVELGMAAERIFAGYDVVDNRHFAGGKRGAEIRERYFLACARFEPKKNFERLIEAYACYARGRGAEVWRLVIAGGGPSRGALEALASRLGVAEGVEFAGLVGYGELPELYGRAGAFVHASTTEQWGLVVNEAMAAGLPVLVSERCGCVAELVKDGENGFTFNPWNVEEIASKMALVAGDAEMRARMGRRSEEIIADWGPERFAAGLRAAVECALERGPQRGSLVSRAVVRLMAMR